jgi:predicted molibdopterin-dependent oxidoreductase YjgC
MRRAHPDRSRQVGLEDAAAIRTEIAATQPLYAGVEHLKTKGDQVQWGGRQLFADGRFATADGKAHFADVALRAPAAEDGRFTLSTRRGKQFNSMVQREVDPLTGAHRDDILISESDLARLGIAPGTEVSLRSGHGEFVGRLRSAPIRSGNLEVHWPEGNVLLSGHVHDPESMEPDYNTQVIIERR